MIVTQYSQYPDLEYRNCCERYGFDLNKATPAEIGRRAVELCDEAAENYPEGSIEWCTFMALKKMWLKQNANRK